MISSSSQVSTIKTHQYHRHPKRTSSTGSRSHSLSSRPPSRKLVDKQVRIEDRQSVPRTTSTIEPHEVVVDAVDYSGARKSSRLSVFFGNFMRGRSIHRSVKDSISKAVKSFKNDDCNLLYFI